MQELAGDRALERNRCADCSRASGSAAELMSDGGDARTMAEAHLSSLGFSDDELHKIRLLFGCSFEPDIDKVKPVLQWLFELGLTDLEVHKVVVACPMVFRSRLEETSKPVALWLKGLGMDDSQVAKTITKFPQLITGRLEENLKPKVQWLKELGMEGSQVSKTITTFPQLFLCSLDANLKPKVQWLRELGLNESQVAKAITKFPPLLGYSLENNLKPKVKSLKEYGFTDTHIVRVLSVAPDTFGRSSSRWAHRFSVLQASGALMSHSSCFFLQLTDVAFAARFESA
eukprot:CAMPEP_0203950220 /NCGR_PEP_ID=MMETSP0359-20131031/84412_1 /ASSEMBLY_ACC=CAM_ASM_000338 /TAXON_ID=268821 /ORGANISM="Scrippsiella Hangoei, Strain SHTV-5" /LENGTH=286 /DNA_ID=CAMNT_0050882373 /DNA_START=179 /DNA_END=1040 /DNA_ORIENTATION=-